MEAYLLLVANEDDYINALFQAFVLNIT